MISRYAGFERGATYSDAPAATWHGCASIGLFVLAVSVHAPIGLRPSRASGCSGAVAARTSPAWSSAPRCSCLGWRAVAAVIAMNASRHWRNRDHPAYWDSSCIAISGLLLALFLPLHFLALGTRVLTAPPRSMASSPGPRSRWSRLGESPSCSLLAAHLTRRRAPAADRVRRLAHRNAEGATRRRRRRPAFCAVAFALNLV